MDDIEPLEENIYIQLLQLSDFDHVQITQCKLVIDRTVYYCGMHSHVSVVHNGRNEYMHELGEAGYSRLHRTDTISIGAAIIDQIETNQTSYYSITLAGSLTADGKCSGTQYTDGYGI